MEKAWPTYRPLIALVIFLPLLLWLGNYQVYGYWLPGAKIGAVAVLIGGYFLLLYGAMLLLLGRGRPGRRLLGLLSLLLLSFSLFEVSYWVIYRLYPQWGLVLYAPDVPYDGAYFRGRMMSNYLVVLLLSLAAALYRLDRLRSRRVLALRTQLEGLKAQFSSAHIYPHFVESVTGTAIGRSLMKSNPGGRQCLEQLAGVMRYVLQAQADPERMVPLGEEWRQVERLAAVARWKYGDQKVSLVQTGEIDPARMTLPVSLVTLLENALKYADLRGQGRISMHLEVDSEGYRFTCTNPVAPQDLPDRPTGAFGLHNLRMRMERSGLALRLEVDAHKDCYTARLCHQISNV